MFGGGGGGRFVVSGKGVTGGDASHDNGEE